MRRGKANVKKSKTENEAEIAPEDEQTSETHDNGENEQDGAGEMNKTDAQKRKLKRGKTQDTETADTENAEPPEKKEKRVPKKSKNATEAVAEESEEYEVEKIVDMKEVRGKRQFKIHWKGYGPESETWEKETDLSCPELIKEFLDQLPDKTKKKPATTKAGKKKVKAGLGDGNANSQTELKEYEVEEVMQMQRKKGKREFLVHWKGFSHDEDTWEPEENLNCPDLIEEFLKKTKTDDKTTKRVVAEKGGRGRQGKSKKRVARQK